MKKPLQDVALQCEVMKMLDITDIIKQEIRSYERDRDTAAKEAAKQAIMQSCYDEFVGVLKLILSKIEKEAENA